MKCKRCDGTGEIVTRHKATHMDPPEDFKEDCPAGCILCEKCDEFCEASEFNGGDGWCADCRDNYDGPGDDYYSDFYGGGQATQDERYREAAEQKRRLG